MTLFLLSRYTAAFAPAARSIMNASNNRATAPIVGHSISQLSKLFMSTEAETIADIEAQIKTKGDEIRQLKEGGIEKADLAPHVQELLALKAKLAPPEEEKPKKKKKSQKQKKAEATTKEKGG